MNIPDKIMLLEHEIKVIRDTGGLLPKAGEYNDWYKRIFVTKDDYPEHCQAETFMHEIFEATNLIFDLGLDHKTLTILSENLFSVIRRNKLDFINP